MNIIIDSLNKNAAKFYCGMVALVLSIIGFIVYLKTGVIAGYTYEYSIAMIIFAIVGILANIVFLVKRVDTFELIPFVAYIICIFLYIAVNANYIAAVVRAIDISSVSGSFIAIILLYLTAAIAYVVGFVFKENNK